MSGQTLQRRVTITNPQGFHMRPVTAFAQRAGKFEGVVTVSKGTQRVNGKSPLELLLLAAEPGVELLLEVSGAEADVAVEALAAILAAPGFDEAATSERQQS